MTPPIDLPEDAGQTAEARWKARRNLVIWIASRGGAAHRLLADVFDLPASKVERIVKDVSDNYLEDRP